MRRLIEFVVDRPRVILIATVILLSCLGFVGAGVATHLKSAGFAPTKTEQDWQYIRDNYPGATGNFVVLVSSTAGISGPAATSAGAQIAQELRGTPGVTGVRSWVDSTGSTSGLVGRSGQNALVVADLRGDDTAVQVTGGELSKTLSSNRNGVMVRAGGIAATYYEMNQLTAGDLATAEAIALPVTLLLLIIFFGSLVAAALPVVIGIVSIVATLGVLRMLTMVTDVSVFALNLTTALGLALAIDYSLFVVNRYREELADGHTVRDAVLRTMATAGRTVLFSGVTVALALSALASFEGYCLRSLAYAGVTVTILAMLTAMTTLPAALMLLGPRIDSLDVRARFRARQRRKPTVPPVESSRWYRSAQFVMRRPVAFVLAGVALLLVLGAPFLGATLGYPDDRAMPTSEPSRQVGDILRADFDGDTSSSITMVMPGFTGSVAQFASDLSRVRGVAAVASPDGLHVNGLPAGPVHDTISTRAGSYVMVRSSLDPYSAQGRAQVDELTAITPPSPTVVGGLAPVYKDALESMFSRLPVALAIVAIVTLVLLFLFTGSVVLPVKAILLNLLSLSASFGALVWIFQDGHLSGLLGFTPTGSLNASIPPLMFCLAFGMSMDYELFVLSRIREEWISSGGETSEDNRRAVAIGIAKTGRIFTAAALLMIVVFLGLAVSRVTFIQMCGVGMVVALMVDATLVRSWLVPAVMQLMGRANWWAPRFLVVAHERCGLSEIPADLGAASSAPRVDAGGREGQIVRIGSSEN